MKKHTRLIWAFILSSIILINVLFPIVSLLLIFLALSIGPLAIVLLYVPIGLTIIIDTLALLEEIKNKNFKYILLSLTPFLILVLSYIFITNSVSIIPMNSSGFGY